MWGAEAEHFHDFWIWGPVGGNPYLLIRIYKINNNLRNMDTFLTYFVNSDADILELLDLFEKGGATNGFWSVQNNWRERSFWKTQKTYMVESH